jgi:hypothetical protein
MGETTNAAHADRYYHLAEAIADGDVLSAHAALQSVIERLDLAASRYAIGRRTGQAYDVDVDEGARGDDAVMLILYPLFGGRSGSPLWEIELTPTQAISLAWELEGYSEATTETVAHAVHGVQSGSIVAPLIGPADGCSDAR